MTLRALAVTSHSDVAERQQLIGLRAAGVDLRVMCPREAHCFEVYRSAGVPVTALSLNGRFDRAGTRRIRQALEAEPHDILHLFNNNAVANGLRASRGSGVKLIAYRGIEGNVSFWDPMSWQTYLNPRLDRIVCVAEAIRRYFLNMRFFGYGLSPEKVRTIYKGHDLGWYQTEPPPRASLGLPENAFVVGSVANDRPRKGLPVLVKALERLPVEANAHLLLVGKMGKGAVAKAVEASPCRERIHLAGFRDDAAALMGACDAYVLPALKREGLPKTVIEAMAYATPPIVTDAGGSPELLQAGDSGWVVPPGDANAIAEALSRWIRDPELKARMGRAAQQRLQREFHSSSTVTQTLALYRELAEPSDG